MRHVPDDELHAYLDQALSRSQAVEIETHLAGCARCRDERDAIAGLRDRTTALLGRLTPRPLIVPPAFQTLVERHMAAPIVAPSRSWRRAGLWAAGFIAAVGLGWGGRSAFGGNPPAETSTPLATLSAPPTIVPHDVAETNLDSVAIPAPVPDHSVRYVAPRPAAYHPAELAPAPLVQLAANILIHDYPPTSLPDPTYDTHSPFEGIWRQVSWEDALKAVGSGLPFIEGMTVLGVLMQPGIPGERPTVIVTQQDPSGEIIQTIEGPATRLPGLVKQQAGPEAHSSEITRTTPDYVEVSGGARRVVRALAVVGRFSADSLNVLARMATVR